jgi:large conductance mechanosensitive channel
MVKEFKQFIMRGNVLDLAVGVIIGGAFGKIVASFVGDILMPPIGKLMGGTDMSGLFLNLSDKVYPTVAAAKAAGAPTLNYGTFLQTIVDFLIVAFAIFMVVKIANAMKREKPVEAPAPTTKDCPMCCTAIPIKAKRCPACTSSLEAAAHA